MDELIDLKAARFIDPRKMKENIARAQEAVEVRRQRVQEGEEQLRHLEQRYEIDMVSARETIAFFEEKVETALEKERYAAALRRRQLALIIAGKMEPNDATELKALFYPEESTQQPK